MERNQRNRSVVFRLSQDEYLKLKAASESNGARNLSEFTRGEVLNFLNSRAVGNNLERTVSWMARSIVELQATMHSLESVVEGLNNGKITAG